MGYVLVTPPSEEPITRAEAKRHLNIDADITADDALIDALIPAVRQYAEQETGRSVMPQAWRKVLDCFPGDEAAPWASSHYDAIYLEKGPVTAITSITYTDLGGVTQTISWSAVANSIQRSTDGALVADLSGGVARIALAFGKIWPIAQAELGAVAVNFSAGWANAAAVPQGLKNWMLLRLGTLYAQREDLVMGNLTVSPLPYADALLNAYRILRV